MSANIYPISLLLMNDKTHIDYIASYLDDKGYLHQTLEVGSLKANLSDTLKRIAKHIKTNTIKNVIVSTEIDSYQTKNLPEFLSELRKIIGSIPVLLLHPSKVHTDEKTLIKRAIKDPFVALQGHDLKTEKKIDLEPVMNILLG